MRLLPAPTEHAGSALMEDPMPDVCARDGHGMRQRTTIAQPTSEAKVHGVGSMR